MKIKGRYDTYDVMWRPCGWSYAQAIVAKRVPFLWWMLWKAVFTTAYRSRGGMPVSYQRARDMYPEELKEWYVGAVKQYEERLDAFKGFKYE